ncbi:MAG: extracellular solute-binding protein [Treponema sp.]|jgi:putative aldouronate transport system substrate-binding protein|nr:extracellular solute-binding protein [Treponema sp.]
MKGKVFLVILLCLCGAALVFAGGQRSGPATAGGSEITLTMINRVNSEVNLENNPLLRHIREKYGFNIEVEAPPINNYNERLQIIMTSGDLPDLVYIWSLNQNYVQWAEQGILRPVDDLVKNYPNIMHNISPEMFESVSIASNGLAYGVPRTNKVNRWGFAANVRWLKQFGMNAPTTVDEFYEFGKRVATGDPDGNGQNDTYLLSPDGSPFPVSGLIVEAFLPGPVFGAPDFDGVYKIREKMNGYYPFLDFMRKLYAERILDPEYFINKTYGGQEKMLQGRVAMSDAHDSGIPQSSIMSNNGAFDFLDFFPPVKASDGKRRNYVTPAVWGVWGLPVSSKKTDDALRFLDWGNSPEGFEVLYLGVPGLTYNSYDLKNRKVDQTEDQRKLWATVTSSYMTVSFAYEGVFAFCSNDDKINDYYTRSLNNYTSQVEDILVPSVKLPEWDAFQANNPDLVTRKAELENKYVIGEISQNELRNFINNEWLPRSAQYEAAYLRLMAARK